MADQSEFTYEPVKVEDFHRILEEVGVDRECNLCGTNDFWYILPARSDRRFLAETYLMSGSHENPYPTLSYFSRTCLKCGNLQSFCTTMIDQAAKAMDLSRAENE